MRNLHPGEAPIDVQTRGSFAAAAVMQARSSTESSCARAQVGMRESKTIKYRMITDVFYEGR